MRIHSSGLLTTAVMFLAFGSRVFSQTAPQNFISVPPCRIADTRTASGGAGPIPGGSYRTFPVVGAPGVDEGQPCNIPSQATAFSLNVTAVPPSSGSLIYLSLLPAASQTPTNAPSSSTLNDPSGTIVANAAIVPSGVKGAVMVYVSDRSDVILDIDGYFVDQTTSANNSTAIGTGSGGSTGANNTAIGYEAIIGGSGTQDTAVGAAALQNQTTGSYNTAEGSLALQNDTTGSYNSALGYAALLRNTTGLYNTALGSSALSFNLTGGDNLALGINSLLDNTAGSENVAVGSNALAFTTGSDNTGVGRYALRNGTTGTSNIALGAYAGSNVADGSYNIEIGNDGDSSDTGVIRIGTGANQSSTYIAGITGATVTGAAVLVNANGQLGVQSSSLRFKEDVHDMADGSNALMELRPVEFRYKQAEADGSKPVQFGLVAEEVAKIYPELVVRNKNGQVDTVQYHQLPAMLLNEIQKQHRTIEQLEERLSALERKQ